MSFGVIGLTVVYGENGAGKSGFARILKRACRARDASEQILPNIFTSAPVRPASAEFHVSASGSDQQIPWHDGAEASPSLTAISVFDGRCARVIIDEDNDAQYLPYGAQVFEDLVKLLKDIRDQLHKEKPLPQKPLWPDIPATTAAGKFLDGVAATTDTSVLGNWTNEDETHLVALAKRLAQAEAEDPTKAAQRQRNLARRM
jgi:hypothetical protein